LKTKQKLDLSFIEASQNIEPQWFRSQNIEKQGLSSGVLPQMVRECIVKELAIYMSGTLRPGTTLCCRTGAAENKISEVRGGDELKSRLPTSGGPVRNELGETEGEKA